MSSKTERRNGYLPPLMRFFGSGMAAATGDVATLLEKLHAGDRLKKLGETTDEAWLAMYRNPQRALCRLADQLYALTGREGRSSVLWRKWRSLLRTARRLTEAEQKQIDERLESIMRRKGLSRYLRRLSSMLEAALGEVELFFEDLDGVDDEKARPAMMSAEMQFLMRVWGPCFVHYQEDAGRLFRKARQGDCNAIEKLFSLDKCVIEDPLIRRHFRKLPSRLSESYGALPPKRKRKQVKETTAGLISFVGRQLGQVVLEAVERVGCKVSEKEKRSLFGYKLTAPAIKGFFDNCSGAATGDPHLRTGETFAKAIERVRDKWWDILQAGQN